MNVALTYYCNQKCAYCFGSDAMAMARSSPQSRQMTLCNLKKMLDFMKRSRVREFNMIGGEPTLHPRFEEFFSLIRDAGFGVSIFSNGVIDKRKVDFLAGQDKLNTVLLNIREPKEYTIQEFSKIEYTLSRLNEKINLSFRIYRLNFNPIFLFDLVDKYKLRRFLNWAIACPSLIRRNKYLILEDHARAAGRMVEFSRISRKRNINWYSDSGFVLCAFDHGKLEELRKNVNFIPETNCRPAIEVAPDLRVFRCYGMAPKSRPGLKITNFKNLEEAQKYFFERSLPLKRVGALDKCFKCEHIISQRCGGGCMVHILKRLPAFREHIF